MVRFQMAFIALQYRFEALVLAQPLFYYLLLSPVIASETHTLA